MKVSIPVTQDEKRALIEAYQNSEHKERCAQGSSKAKFIAPCARAVKSGMVSRPTHLEMYLRERAFGSDLADDLDAEADDADEENSDNEQSRDEGGKFQ